MASFINAVSAVFVLMLLMAVGYVLGGLGWIGPAEKTFISRFVVNVGVPANCIVSLLNNLNREELLRSGIPLLSGLLSIGLTLVVGAAGAKLLKLPRARWGVFAAMVGTSNTIFIGLPVTIELFGQAGVPSLMLYFLPSAILTQSAAVMLIEWSGSAAQQGKESMGSVILGVLKKAPMVGVMTGMALLLANLRPPEQIMTFLNYIGSTVTPMAMVYCGFVVYEVGLKNLHFDRGMPALLVLRLGVAPLICMGLCLLLGVGGETMVVFTVVSALPVASQMPVFAGIYGADEKFAATAACMTMLGCFVTIPILMTILG